MSISDWVTIIAIIAGPIIAVRLTRFLDDQKEIRERKLWIFKTLMASRATMLSTYHVEALNRIDLEFSADNKREKEVIEAWKAYLDILNNTAMPADQWALRRVDLVVELLHKMAKVLNYDFDKTTIKNSSYFPRGHGEMEEDQAVIRRGLKELIEGKRVIPMYVTNFPAPQDGSKSESGGG